MRCLGHRSLHCTPDPLARYHPDLGLQCCRGAKARGAYATLRGDALAQIGAMLSLKAAGMANLGVEQRVLPDPIRPGLQGLHLRQHQLTFLLMAWAKGSLAFGAGAGVDLHDVGCSQWRAAADRR